MLRAAQKDVEDFHRACELPVGDRSRPALQDELLRVELIREEFEELKSAIEAGDLVAAADALADIAYVTLGAAVTWGIDLGLVWDEVQRSNMTKAPNGKVIRNAAGKVLKPEGWIGPDIKSVLERQRGR